MQNWTILMIFYFFNYFLFLGEGGKKTGSGWTRASNSDKLSDKGRARA